MPLAADSPVVEQPLGIGTTLRVHALDGGKQHHEERHQIVVVLVKHQPRER